MSFQILKSNKINVILGNNDLINSLAKKPMFKTKQDLFKLLDYQDSDIIEQEEPHEYLSQILMPEMYDMSSFAKQAGCINIYDLQNDLSIDCITEEVEFDFISIQTFENYNIGTTKFFDSVNTVSLNYNQCNSKPEVDKNINTLSKYFKNSKKLNLKNIR